MLIWMIVAIVLAFLGVIEPLLGFTIPFIELRVVLLFLLILGMAYRLYIMERSGEKETLKRRVRELEEKCGELEGRKAIEN